MDVLDIFGREIRKAQAFELAQVRDLMPAGQGLRKGNACVGSVKVENLDLVMVGLVWTAARKNGPYLDHTKVVYTLFRAVDNVILR